jgi:2-methylcitrate dehydratase PrpD
MAAELAALGLSGPTHIYEAVDGGLLSTFTDEPDPERLLDRLGEHWHAPDTNFKPYGCCGSAHAHVDAALSLRPRRRRGGRVRAGMAAVVEQQCGYRYEPGSALNAQMSLRYAVAAALLHGEVPPAQFESACLNDPALMAQANEVDVVHDPRHDAWYPAQFCGWVEVETNDGAMERLEVMNPSGSAANPHRRQAIQSKFAALVSGLLDAGQVARVQAGFDRFDRTPLASLLDAAVVAPA